MHPMGLSDELKLKCTDISICIAAGIRLAGATSDVHVLDVRTGRWDKIEPAGEPPSPRAAHAAAAVGSMVVVQVAAQRIASTFHDQLSFVSQEGNLQAPDVPLISSLVAQGCRWLHSLANLGTEGSEIAG